MKKKITALVGMLALLFGMVAIQGCFIEGGWDGGYYHHWHHHYR